MMVMLSEIIYVIIERYSDISVGVNLSWTAVAITLVCSIVLGVICETMPIKHATKLESTVAFRQ